MVSLNFTGSMSDQLTNVRSWIWNTRSDVGNFIDDIDSHWELPTQFWQKPLWASTQGGKKKRNKKRTLLARSNKEQTGKNESCGKHGLAVTWMRTRGQGERSAGGVRTLRAFPVHLLCFHTTPGTVRPRDIGEPVSTQNLHTKSPYKASGSISRMLMHNDRAHM